MESPFVGTLFQDLIIATVVGGAQPYIITSRLRVVVAGSQGNIPPRVAVRKGAGHFDIGGPRGGIYGPCYFSGYYVTLP